MSCDVQACVQMCLCDTTKKVEMKTSGFRLIQPEHQSSLLTTDHSGLTLLVLYYFLYVYKTIQPFLINEFCMLA